MMRLKNNKGITLVMLIITIVVMLILAGTVITMVSNDGITRKAEETAQANKLAEDREYLEMKIIKILEEKTIITVDDLKLSREWKVNKIDDGNVIECISPNDNKITIDKYGEILD